jgi:hypothetical protein
MTDQINNRREVLFEGLSESEILALPIEQIDALVLTGQPIVFRAGSATVLGEFRLEKDRLILELAQIDGGGEDVLVSLGSLARRYSRLHGIEAVEWIVHAVNCAKPNLKLRRILERRGFAVRELPKIGQAYYFLDSSSHIKRAGWTEESRELSEAGEDVLVLPEFANETDADLQW